MSVTRSVGPQFSVPQASEIASTLYGITEFIRELPSERDQNLLFRRNDGREFILKIANRDEQRATLDLQNQAMAHVGGAGAVVPTKTGEQITTVDGHLIRLVSYISGVPLAEFRPHSTALLNELGRMLGRTDRKLASFEHPAAQRELYWDIRNAERIITLEPILRAWREVVVPRLPELRTSVIHNDANDYNLIVSTTSIRSTPQIALIDFGDMLETYTLCEPAIACAYAMMHKPDPLAAAADIIQGYHEEYPLTETEIELMYHFIRTRLAMSVCIAAQQKKLEPDNEYLGISEAGAWALLEKLDAIPPALAHYTFREACGLTPCPQTPAIEQFLRENTSGFSKVIDADLSGKDAFVLDMSISSLELGVNGEFADVVAASRAIFRKLEDAGAKVAIGRYNEPRGVYTSPQFAAEGNDGREWRTVHLGIDLFAEAGTPLFAPLDGVVHALKNNAVALDYGPTVILKHTAGELSFYTLYGHLSVDSLERLQVGQTVRRGEQVAKIGTYPTNGGWPPHVHFQVVTDMLGRDGEFPGVAPAVRRDVWLSLSPDPNLILGIAAGQFPPLPPTKEQTLAARRETIGRNLSISYQSPLKIVRGSGAYLFDDVGRGYLDCVNNVAHVGHCHPTVVRAAQRQTAVLNTNTRYLHDNIIEYARRLTAKFPPALSVCFFVNSGSEANDLALRLARTHTRTKNVIVMDTGYHGNLTSLVEISPYKFDGPGGFPAPPYVHKVRLADTFRGGFRSDDVRSAVKTIGGPSTLIMESLLSCAGQMVLPDGYLDDAYRAVREAGGLCIADEVQVGFGRVGSHFWGFETQGVVPDIVTMGKSIGGGHPLAAVVTTQEIAASFNNGMEYFNTYGGNPVSCAVGTAVLDVIENQRLTENALRVGGILKSRLGELKTRYPLVGDVRGLGLFLGIEFVRDRGTLEPAADEASYIVERMKERGILLSTDGKFHNVIKIKPPMVFSESDCEFLVSSLDLVLGENVLR
jgi:4-aminobutyrate aminotransferase-like enzyme/Ser/Thr protein kinase RdoA (MazF antagonist)/murein DD-endopeptidase MepM/ murein hydrolase activator NlpD